MTQPQLKQMVQDDTAAKPRDSSQPEAFYMLGRYGAEMMQNMARLGTEWAEFVNMRLKEDAKTQHELLNCRDMTKLAEIQARFMKTAMEQYAVETGKILQIGNELLQSAGKDRQN